jgi:hypothetical protein
MKIAVSKKLSGWNSTMTQLLKNRGPELLTIIISILLALSIESWTDNRKDQKKLQDYYKNISNEIIRDTADIVVILADTKMRLDTMIKYAKLIKDYKPEYQDTIQYFCTTMMGAQFFNTSSMISYQSMIISGDFKLIDNLEIREKLIGLEEEYASLKVLEDLYMTFFKEELMNVFFSNFDLFRMKLLKPDYFKGTEFRNLVIKYNSMNTLRLEQYEETLIQAHETYTALIRELKK